MKAYSQDLREKVLRAVDQDYPRGEIVKVFGVSLATIKRYVTVSASKAFDSVLTTTTLSFGSFGSWTPPTSLSASVTMMVVVP